VSDVTKRIIVCLAGVLAVVVAVGVALSLTVLRPEPDARIVRTAALVSRVPGAVLPTPAAEVFPVPESDPPKPSGPVLTSALRPLITAAALGRSVSVDVLDPRTGQHLLAQAQTTPRTPASTTKLLTSAAALTALGPQTRLATTVVAGASPGQVVLVGGGDVLLARGNSDPSLVSGRAGLTTLARQTAAALTGQGVTTVSLALDDTLFSGPVRAPSWDRTDVSEGFVAPIQPLEINAGRSGPADYASRANDPALAAAQVFARLLGRQGIHVSGAVRREKAAPAAKVLGRVDSAPISELVEYALTYSDNTVAETLGRLVAAKSGRPASFAEVGPAVLAQDRQLGIPVTGAVLADGSGLSDSNKVSPLALTQLLALATDVNHPQLRAILTGLPVAAVSGTLLNRFSGPHERVAAGVVRAKTGTLTGVDALAGTVVDADGRLLVFAAMADRTKAATPAREALDKVATTLAACGCR